MVSKNVLILTGVLVVGAAVVMMLDHSGKRNDPRLGRAVLQGADVAGIDRVEVKKGELAQVLVRDGDGVWHLGDVKGFPVDAGHVLRLGDDLNRATFQAVASTNKDSFSEFGLLAPVVLTLSSQGKEILALSLGDQRKGGGQYVTTGGEYKVYLISSALAASPDAEGWELKSLVNLDKALVKSVKFTPPAGTKKAAVTLGREKADDAIKVTDPADVKINEQASKKVESTFAGISFAKRYDLSNAEFKAAMLAPAKVSLTLFDGRTYEFLVGSLGSDQQKKYYMVIHGEKNGATLPDGDQKALESLNQIMAQYAFEVPVYVAERFDKSLEDFVQPEPKG